MKNANKRTNGILFLPVLILFSNILTAQVNITSTATTYIQNFNALKAISGTSSTLPIGWKLLEASTNANKTYTTDNGASSTGDTYSYGTGTSTERAFGTLRSGSLISTLGAQIKNSTGQTITSLTISYTGEQWRCGAAARADQLTFQYSLNATSLSTGTWTDNSNLHFSSPNTIATGVLDGNAAANRIVKSTVITGLSIPANAIFWLRWNDVDASGADDGLAIDDFSIRLNAGDAIPPAIAALNPANGAVGVSLSGNLAITFNENIQKGTAGSVVIKKTSDGSIVNTTAVTSGTVTISGSVANIPFSGLAYSTGYYVEVAAATFKDIAGNNFAGITGATTWAFTTQAAPAASVSVNPASLSFGFVAAGSTSVQQTFAFSTTNLTADLTLSSPTGFSLSKDGAIYATFISYTLAEAQAGQTVFVRFAPPATNTTYGGLINFSSVGLNDLKEQLSGNSNVAPPAGPLNFYYGNLHAHSSYSDGNKDNTLLIPADDYEFAKSSLCFDFLGLSEHNHTTAGMQLSNWQPGRTQASAASTPSFVGMYGMEWGVISGGGHVLVYGVDSLIGWEANQNQIYVPKSVYRGTGGLFDIINRHGNNAFATLAHPNTTDYNKLLDSTFDVAADDAIVGTAIESGPAFSTNITYSDPGASLSYLGYYRNMLSRGFHLGPTIDHDNHNLTFGRTTRSRLVVMASSLSEASLLDGMRKMRFYASQDCAAKITYNINSQPMGSIITQEGVPTITLSSITSNNVTSVIVMYGVPGSGVAATQLTSTNTGSLTFTDNGLANLSQRYYYLDITESDGSRIITSPIWYTRNDAAAFARNSITSFFTVDEEKQVALKWTTESEEKNETFIIERSINGGRTYQQLGQFNGKGGANDRANYGMTDLQPHAGVAYYRLVQKNVDGFVSFTDIKVVDRSDKPSSYFTVYPNPVQGILNVKLTAVAAQRTAVKIMELNGRSMITQQVSLATGPQNIQLDMSRLQKGSYIISITLDGVANTRIVNKL